MTHFLRTIVSRLVALALLASLAACTNAPANSMIDYAYVPHQWVHTAPGIEDFD